MMFNTREFAEFNKHKCDKIHYLDFEGLNIIFGEKNGEFYSPFSAPFGGFYSLKKNPSLEQIESACNSLGKWNNNLHITFPPMFYNESFFSKCISAMMRCGFKIDYMDLNFYFDLSEPIKMQQSAKSKWNVASRNNLRLVLTDDIKDKQIAYEIINNNRKERGYPPHLSFEELCETGKVTKSRLDWFLVYADQEPIAAALVFNIEPQRALAVIWGDKREKQLLRPMNFLAISMAEYYKSQNYISLDMTASSKEGIPIYGLCFFKERLGCKINLKYTLSLCL